MAGVVLVAVSGASFGGLGVLARVAYDDGGQPVAVLAGRFVIAALCFGALQLVRRRPLPPPRALAGLLVMGVCYLLQSLCYFSAIEHAPPGLVALLLYTYPALVVLLGVLLLGLRLTRTAAVACAVALTGTALVVGPSARSGDTVGIVFGLSAAGVYACYILVGSRVLRQVDAVWASTVIMTTAAVGYGLAFLLSPNRPALPASSTGWLAIVGMALLCTVVAVLTFLAGLARVGPADASTISTIEPLVSVVLSALVTGEVITGWTVAGGTLVLASVITLSRASGSGSGSGSGSAAEPPLSAAVPER
jgi:drug/metabolite transporter (DMT)-like permease